MLLQLVGLVLVRIVSICRSLLSVLLLDKLLSAYNISGDTCSLYESVTKTTIALYFPFYWEGHILLL